MSLMVLPAMPEASAFDYDNQRIENTSGPQDTPAFFNTGSRNDREEASGSSCNNNAGPRRVPGFYMEPVVFQVKADCRCILYSRADIRRH